MKRKLFTLLAVSLFAATAAFAQDKMEVKDANGNLLMQVNDEGSAGSITLPGLGAVPAVFTDKIYSIGGELYFNGAKLSSLWSLNGANIFYNGGNVGVGTAAPNSHAALDIDAANNDKGVLLPRLTTGQRTAISGLGASEEGLLAYDETTDSFWFWSGSQWNELGSAGGGGDNLGNHTATQTLNLNGNSISNADTVNAAAFVGGADGVVFEGASGSGTPPASGPGARMMWYPGKSAFRAGEVDGNQWDEANIGAVSVAFGFDNVAKGVAATISGGIANTASGNESTISGGTENTASGYEATVAGGRYNSAAGDNSFAAGRRAKIDAAHDGAFLFSDQNDFDFNSSAANEFAARATGGVRFVTGIDGSGNPNAGVKLDASGNAWTDLNGNPIGGSDNLGNHTATQTLNLNGNSISNADTVNAAAFVGGADGVLFNGAFGTGTLAANGAGTRMMWYPGKAAFRAGIVDGNQWDDANIGIFSVALGSNNTASGEVTTVSGGDGNTASGLLATVGGGADNIASEFRTTVSGGGSNQAKATGATVSGGYSNVASGLNATISGGDLNTASGFDATVAGGNDNSAAGDYSFAAGRRAKIDAAHDGAVLFSDQNDIDFNSSAANEFAARATGGVRFVTGIDGSGNPNAGVKLDASGNAWTDLNGNPIGGSDNLGNHTATQTLNLNGNSVSNADTVNAAAFVGGADGVLFNGAFGTGTLAANGAGTRMMWYPGKAAFRAGEVDGSQWDDANIGAYSVALGENNTASGLNAVVSGGVDNEASGDRATVSGGYSNEASGSQATVSGGLGNRASGGQATVSGGWSNEASGAHSTVAGGVANIAAADNSFAAGYGAIIYNQHPGTFLFSDNSDAVEKFYSAAANEFAARATGGVRFVTGIDGSGNPTAGVKVDASSNTWTDLNGNPIGGNDNLGNHTATQTLNLNGNYLSGDGGNEGVFVDGSGNVGIGTTSPSAALQVTIDQSAAHFGGIRIDNTNPTVSGERTVLLDLVNNDASSGKTYRLQNVGNAGNRSGNFEIFDISAGSARLAISPTGNVGIGTANPGAKLEVSGTATGGVMKLNGGDEPVGANNFTQMAFGYNGSNDFPHFLVTRHNNGIPDHNAFDFYTSDGTQNGVFPANAVLGMTINNGKVGIGTRSPAGTFQALAFSQNTDIYVSNSYSTGTIGRSRIFQDISDRSFSIENDGADDTWKIVDNTVNRIRFTIDYDGNVGIGNNQPQAKLHVEGDALANAHTTPSSRRWKTNIHTIDNALETVQQLRGVTYDWKKTGKHDIGLIAEEVGAIIPEIVTYEENGIDAKSVDYPRLVAVLIEAVKAQQSEITALKSQNDKLASQNSAFEKRFAQIETALLKMNTEDGKSQITSTK